ncbi:MAG: hypothetical protein QM500_04540 [Methylococcales bacterium]
MRLIYVKLFIFLSLSMNVYATEQYSDILDKNTYRMQSDVALFCGYETRAKLLLRDKIKFPIGNAKCVSMMSVILADDRIKRFDTIYKRVINDELKRKGIGELHPDYRKEFIKLEIFARDTLAVYWQKNFYFPSLPTK